MGWTLINRKRKCEEQGSILIHNNKGKKGLKATFSEKYD